MDRVAVFVDAGYVFAQGAILLTGQKQPRGDMTLMYLKVVEALENVAKKLTGLPLLRIYWYDGTSTGPTSQHIALAHLPNVKVRLGFVNTVGQQKGVDSLIVTDMITLARNRAIADAVLFSGDEDLRVGVQQAQEFGVRVHLVGIKPARGSQSVFLMQEADTTMEWTDADITSFLQHTPRPTPPISGAPTPVPSPVPRPIAARTPSVVLPTSLDALAREIALQVPVAELAALVANIRATTQVPPQFDRPMLARARGLTGADLSPAEKRAIRSVFLQECEKRLADQGGATRSST